MADEEIKENGQPQDELTGSEQLEGGQALSYEEKVQFEPEREVQITEYKPPSVKTIDEEEDETKTLTDKQAILRALRPRYKDAELNEIAKSVRDSRVFPDNFTDKHFLLSAAHIEKHINDKDFNPMFSISHIQDMLSVGFEGRGIADLEELAGAESTEQLDKVARGLGL